MAGVQQPDEPSSAESAPHRFRLPDGEVVGLPSPPDDTRACRAQIEPWLSSMFQAEHLSLLLGRGFTLGVGAACGERIVDVDALVFPEQFAEPIFRAAAASAVRIGRGEANFEDQIRCASELLAGLRILRKSEEYASLSKALDGALQALLEGILRAEGTIERGLAAVDAGGSRGRDALGPFLMSFASRSASRERLHIFTTNYDRVIEHGCDRTGLRIVDRFVGAIEPVFRSSRLEVDLHYNPPGIRGEPRFLEGVIRLTKLHGSADWRFSDARVRRIGLPFGGRQLGEPSADPSTAVVIFPNASKDVETSEYPYSELFRDFSAGVCRPNSVLVAYGYGFGDSHINATIRDMLTIPSTHLVIISFDEAGGRIRRFIDASGHDAQISYLIGSHFGDLTTLTRYYLPKPAIDIITARRSQLVQERGATARALDFAGPSDEGERAPE